MRTVYVQQQHKDWLNENCFASAKGFERMGYTVIPFEMDQIDEIAKDKRNIIHGGINTVRKSFDLLGIEQPPIHNPQDHLQFACKRNFYTTTLGQIRDGQFDDRVIFIKPLEDHKLFTGFVYGHSILDGFKIRRFGDDVKILASEAMHYESEYRCFVLNTNLVGSKHYSGDFRLIPDYDLVQECIKKYERQPIAYSIDFAITDTGETQLIEINDSFALGHYGLTNVVYCKMIEARWDEIVGNKKFY